jgi:hypothetical protein
LACVLPWLPKKELHNSSLFWSSDPASPRLVSCCHKPNIILRSFFSLFPWLLALLLASLSLINLWPRHQMRYTIIIE